MHYNPGLPELKAKEIFEVVQRGEYDWVHLEGRPNEDGHLQEAAKAIKNMKKPPKNIHRDGKVPRWESLLPVVPFADLIFISKELAKSRGAEDKVQALTILEDHLASDATIVCAWGDQVPLPNTPPTIKSIKPPLSPRKRL